jgi:Ca-activated chloride channel family protein
MIHYRPQPPRGSRYSQLLITVVCSLLCCAYPVLIRAQEPDDVIRVRTDLVGIPVIVTDGRGRRVSGLTAKDFLLTSDLDPPKVDYFASGTERVALLFALDTSGSARETITRQHEAAAALFSRFGHGSRVAVLQFGNVVRLTVPFTTNANAAQDAFKVGARENSGTAIFDGAALAVRAFDGSGGFSMERRIVILMSDGLDTLSATKYQAIIEAARRRGVSFYVVHFPLFSPSEGRLEPRSPSKGFRELAEQTGGRYFRIGDAKTALDPRAKIDLTRVFQAIEEDLSGQYVVGFYPGEAARDNRFHRVTVSLASASRKKLRVQQFAEGFDLKP